MAPYSPKSRLQLWFDTLMGEGKQSIIAIESFVSISQEYCLTKVESDAL